MRYEQMLMLASEVQKQYADGKSYLKKLGFLDKWPEYERFKAGDQWPPVTDRTKHLPRPVFNIIRYIENHKVSSVANENIKMMFSTQEEIGEDDETSPDTQPIVQLAQDGADKFTRYSDTTWENIKQDELNEESLESGSNTGTGIWHYYWDPSVKGGLTQPYQGEMCGETIDPINIFFGNEQNRNTQKQPYILISSREMVKTVKEEAQANGLSLEVVALIKGDNDTQDEGYDSAKVELTEGDKTTVLTRYWKKGGFVWFTRICGNVVIKEPTNTGMKRYPIVVMQWERRKKSIRGIGDTEGLIPNQKAINFLVAMMLLSAQRTGWPKAVINPEYVDPNSINNDPTTPIIDKSPAGMKGIEYLQPSAASGMAKELVDMFVDYTKSLSSAQDAATGDISKGNLNATAIMLLQKASGVPIESIKRRFYRAMEEVGRIWEEFWKAKYNTTRRVNLKDDNGQTYSADFKGSNYQNVNMNLKIDIGPSSSYSEELMMASLDKLFEGGQMGLEDYLEFAPKNVVPFKDRMLKKIKAAKELKAKMIVTQMPPEMQAEYAQASPEEQDLLVQQFEQSLASQPQVDPQIEGQNQLNNQIALKNQDHLHKVELKQIEGQQKKELAAMKQPVVGTR